MKVKKYNSMGQFWGKYLGLLWGICFILSACSDEWEPPVRPEASSVSIRIQLPAPMAQSVHTRAGVVDFNTIKDVNILIADGETIIERGHYHFLQGEGAPSVPMNAELPELTWTDQHVLIHFGRQLTAQDNLTKKRFFIVANYGKKITEQDAASVTALKQLKQSSSSVPGVPLGCMMFAEAVHTGETHTHPDGTVGATLHAQLERTVAMVSVKIDASQLARNVCLSHFAISLHNVPTECTIGQDNLIELNAQGEPIYPTQVSSDGEWKDANQLDWHPVVGVASTIECGRTTWKSYPQQVGGHYSSPDANVSDRSVDPLFLFENMHPEGFGHPDVTPQNQGHKRPASLGPVTDKHAIEKQSKTCSYLKVTANYERIDPQGNTVIAGKVSFKLFLGSNVLNDFNVRGNHYYQVTLCLAGNAVTEGGQINDQGELEANPQAVTWRVDTHLSRVSFVNSDLNFNAGGEYFYIDITGNETCFVQGEGSYFVWVYGSPNPDGSYPYWQSAAEGTYVKPTSDGKGRILAYVQPAFNEADIPGISREITLTLQPASGGEKSTLKITQYDWLSLSLSVKDYPYLKEVFGSNIQNVNLKLDRVDRVARPWGFYGEEVHINDADGFNNAYYLFAEKTPEPGCTGHREFARRYLPFGTETRLPDGTVLEDGGSAMMYGALLYLNQEITSPDYMLTPEVLMKRDFPTIDKQSDPENKKWYWAIPSLEAWQMIEKEAMKGHLDPNFPIRDWFQYWSSDAVTRKSPVGTTGASTGQTHAYAYQFGRGLHTLKADGIYPDDLRMDRRDRLRFRLVSLQPQYTPFRDY